MTLARAALIFSLIITAEWLIFMLYAAELRARQTINDIMHWYSPSPIFLLLPRQWLRHKNDYHLLPNRQAIAWQVQPPVKCKLYCIVLYKADSIQQLFSAQTERRSCNISWKTGDMWCMYSIYIYILALHTLVNISPVNSSCKIVQSDSRKDMHVTG